ncbi:MAG: reverse transcriptase/maturase family protein [Deltaproteobacteria bacterium]|nr:reverse transcriptase/maturase family protein [Deltaproteobacteria bacterium]
MKRYGNLFEKAFSMENLYQAYLDARRGKRTHSACFEFDRQIGSNLRYLHEALHAGTYRPDPYHEFVVTEPKRRIIHAPSFRDVVVQHAIYRIIYDIFDRSFIDQSFACRIGYGTHKAAAYARRAMQKHSGDEYVLKMDIRKFFYSIDRAALRKLIEKKIKDERLVDIMMMFAHMDAPLGIPIGNLLSQIYALIYLNPVDHFIKRVLRIRHYVRYVDDFLLIGLSRGKCLDLREKVIGFLQTKLGLGLSRSTIAKVRKGVNFCGYRMWRSRIFIRKYSLCKFRRMVRAGKQESVNSLLGHACNTWSLFYMLKIIKEKISDGIDLQIPKNYRRYYDALPA